MPPILNPAPAWMPDRSDFVILWHGCTANDKNNIQKGIDLDSCNPSADFGRGFYTTTVKRQARQWAWHRHYDWMLKNPQGTGNPPVILQFRVRRYSTRGSKKQPLKRGLDELKSLSFVIGDYHNEDYWSLVQHCRQSNAQTICDHKRPKDGWYDLVSGPVAAFWDQRVAMDDADQFSFHTDAGVEILDAVVERGLQKGTSGDPDYYTWFPVP